MSEAMTRESAIGWQLPPFYCPIELDVEIHPQAKELEERAVEWIDNFGFYRDATERAWGLATHSTDFSCRIIPHGAPDPLLLFIEWNYWAFAVDDWQDSGTRAVSTALIADHSARLIRAVEAPGSATLPPGPATAALDDLVGRTWTMLTPFQRRRFADGVRDWLLGAGWQTANSERGVMPSLNDFATIAVLANGTRFSLAFSDIANGSQLPPDVLYSAPVQAVTEAAGFLVNSDNDLFSYAKDDHHELSEQNLVNVIAHQDGCSPKEALPKAVAFRDRVMTLFLRLREQLAKTADSDLGRYLDSLGHYVSGSITWMSTAPRYASPRNRHPLPVPGAVCPVTYRDTPSDSGTEPPAVPSIAWWWAQLKD